jgi:hypothetical protein
MMPSCKCSQIWMGFPKMSRTPLSMTEVASVPILPGSIYQVSLLRICVEAVPCFIAFIIFHKWGAGQECLRSGGTK